MRYPLSIKTALSQVLQGPPPAHPGSMKAQQDAAAAAAAAGIVPGEEEDQEGGESKSKEKTAVQRMAAAGKPVTERAAPGAEQVLPAPPATGSVATPTSSKPPKQVKTQGFRYPLTKTSSIEVSRRPALPSAPRQDFNTDPTMGVGETLATQLAGNLQQQMVPMTSPMDPIHARPAHPLKHLV